MNVVIVFAHRATVVEALIGLILLGVAADFEPKTLVLTLKLLHLLSSQAPLSLFLHLRIKSALEDIVLMVQSTLFLLTAN